MSIVRGTARALIAIPFVIDGLSALIHPGEHVEKAQEAWRTLEDWGAPSVEEGKWKVVARTSGAITAGLGVALILGPAKRLTGTALAATTVPLLLMNSSILLGGGKNARKAARRSLVDQAALTGGLLLIAADLGGKPSLKWRRYYASQRKDAVAAARAAVSSAVSE
jgi:DoxX.